MAPKSPAHFLPIGFVSLFVPFCLFLQSKKDLEKVGGKILQNVEQMRAECNPAMPAHVSQRAVTALGPNFVDFDPLWTTLFRSQKRLAKKATTKTQKRRLNIFWGVLTDFGLNLGGGFGGKFATFSLFFTTPAPKAAQRDPGAPPASKCIQNEPKWTPK